MTGRSLIFADPGSDMRHCAGSPYIERLANAHEPADFGGKAANLARMHRLGCPIPNGWAIGAWWLRQHLVSERAQRLLAAVDDALAAHADDDVLAAAGRELTRFVLGQPVQTALMVKLGELLKGAPGKTWVVRSSAIGEDSALASFAGQLDSVLHCRSLEDIARAVRQVWASAWSSHCLAYSKHSGQRLGGVGVVLCEQLQPRHAGVLFTEMTTPEGDQALRIEYTEGLADRLVAGAVTPASAWLGRQDLQLREHDTAELPSQTPPMCETVLRALAERSMALERAWGAPLDIEWCSLDDSPRSLVFVQARPITTGSPTRQRAHLWSNANIAENFPDAVCPLVDSFVRQGYHAYFQGLGRVFGVPRREIDRLQPALSELVGTHRGRLYYNLTRIHEVFAAVPMGARLAGAFATFTGAPPPSSGKIRPLRSRLADSGRLLRTAASLARHYLPVRARVRRFEAIVDAYHRAHPPGRLQGVHTEALARSLEGFLHIRQHQWQDASLADCSAMLSYASLQVATRRWLPDAFAQSRHQSLLKGLTDLPSNRPVVELWSLAQRLKAIPSIATALGEMPTAELARRLDDPALHPLGVQVRTYIEQWGFRSSRELTLLAPTPHEDPQGTLELLKRYVQLSGAGPAEQLREQGRQREAVERELRAALASDPCIGRLARGLRPFAYGLLGRATQGSVKLRERVRFKQALLYACLRHVALASGTVLAAQRLLAERDDVFMLTMTELIALLRGQYLYPCSLGELVRARRQAMRAAACLEPPDLLELEPGQTLRAPSKPRDPGSEGARSTLRSFQGTAACAGLYEGEAIVLEDASQIHRMEPGQVLVTRQTDPGWASAFFLAKALVVERGGMLSHGAIVAREFGIPAVVGIPGITRAIHCGEQVRVSGFGGTVERL